jgi:hypothetical protein
MAAINPLASKMEVIAEEEKVQRTMASEEKKVGAENEERRELKPATFYS